MSKYWLLVYLFFLRHMSCLNKSNMKIHLIPSIARCASSSFSVWRNMKNIYIFFRRKSLTRHTLPLMKLGEISYLTYLGMAYASKKKYTSNQYFDTRLVEINNTKNELNCELKITYLITHFSINLIFYFD